MFQRILVPLDGSARAELAIPVAAQLARSSGASITLLRVVPSTTDAIWLTTDATGPEQAAPDNEIVRAANYLARIATTDVLSGISTLTEVCKAMPARAILSVARAQQADIIILCSRGYTGMARQILGSVAEKVAFHSPVPVFVLHEDVPILPDTAAGSANWLRAIIALDGSELAETAIEPAAYLIAGLATRTQGNLHLVRVVTQRATDPRGKDLDQEKAKAYIQSTEERLQEGHLAPAVANLKLPVSGSVALDADVATALHRTAKQSAVAKDTSTQNNYNVIVMATHGFGGIQRWTMGSVTQHVLKTTRLPLLIVRPLDSMERSELSWEKAIQFTI